MEILSIGEKIKRARIYKGITLKELCGSRISISKMSCIENSKINASGELLQYIADKLKVDYNYLAQGIREQIEDNIKYIRDNSNSTEELEEIIKNNLNYAVQYSYVDLALELIHKLFNYYLKSDRTEEIFDLIPQYYELYKKESNDKNTIVYYNDMANFFYVTKEYKEAIIYYKRIRELLCLDILHKVYIISCIREGDCYLKINRIKEAYNLLGQVIDKVDILYSDFERGNAYIIFAALSIRMGEEFQSKEYIKKANEILKDEFSQLTTYKLDIAKSYFDVGNKDLAIKEINEGIDTFPQDNKKKYVEFLSGCMKLLYEYGEFQLAYELCDNCLNNAININEMALIEEAYYFKGMLLQKQGMYFQAEMYMNLALDSLFKIESSKDKKYKRYLDMANMYYKLRENNDALKYFNLAIKTEDEF